MFRLGDPYAAYLAGPRVKVDVGASGEEAADAGRSARPLGDGGRAAPTGTSDHDWKGRVAPNLRRGEAL